MATLDYEDTLKEKRGNEKGKKRKVKKSRG